MAEQLSFFDKGDKVMRDAQLWIEKNPTAWTFMVATAQAKVKQGRRFGIKDLCEHVRWRMYADGLEDGFKLNNNISPALARLILREVPEAQPYLKIKKSVVDRSVL